jgi:hypothetical protein
MTLDHDVVSTNGNLLILKAGTVLTEIWIERLGNITQAKGGLELVGVRIPKAAVLVLTEARERLARHR